MYVDNMEQCGLLVNNDNVQVDRKHADLYELFENRWVSHHLLIRMKSDLSLGTTFAEINSLMAGDS